ncbi:hypothetical protein PS467_14690 [Streptomyces luomodiensis]|uniref:Secreted protein n=1 Tax=Streptomyces luomodiensis TaxID=3026192 RepID=A0ABY9UXB1_9ACTN|nr:hypothetical protein [Streptomyces sp. SCA4-21]WNE96494.1 hypothetical protein PS467_14690 [Streptomyces sp. SCA4-21]
MTRTRGLTLAGIAAAATLGLAVPASATTADVPPSWDYVTSTKFFEIAGVYYSYNAESHGGEFHACIHTSLTGQAQYALYESDPDSSHERIGSIRTQTAGGCETWNVSAYVDGSNNRAELYIATNDPWAYKVDFYD